MLLRRLKPAATGFPPQNPAISCRGIPMKHSRLVPLFVLLALTAALFAQEKAPSYPPAAEVKAAFLKLLDRPKVPLDPKTKDTKTDNGLVTEHLSIASEKKADGTIERVPILLI